MWCITRTPKTVLAVEIIRFYSLFFDILNFGERWIGTIIKIPFAFRAWISAIWDITLSLGRPESLLYQILLLPLNPHHVVLYYINLMMTMSLFWPKWLQRSSVAKFQAGSMRKMRGRCEVAFRPTSPVLNDSCLFNGLTRASLWISFLLFFTVPSRCTNLKASSLETNQTDTERERCTEKGRERVCKRSRKKDKRGPYTIFDICFMCILPEWALRKSQKACELRHPDLMVPSSRHSLSPIWLCW